MSGSFIPLWLKGHIKEEILVFVKGKNGTKAHLLFDAVENVIISDRKGNILKENVDYRLKNNEVILLNETLFYYEEQWLKNLNVPSYISNENTQYGIERCLLISPEFLRETQFLAEYDYKRSDFPNITLAGSLPLTKAILKERKFLKTILFGDSISNAANSSWEMGYKNYEHWITTSKKNLEKYFDVQIEIKNISVSGQDSNWAATVADERINDTDFDFVIIAFGMNDVRTPNEIFVQNVERIIEAARHKNRNAEFIIVSTPLPNESNVYGNQIYQYDGLKRIADSGVAVLNMTEISEYLIKRKNYCEISGNNLNHPNDFFYRIYSDVFTEFFIETLNGKE